MWRWFDAVVVATDPLALWEPGHGRVPATPRSGAPALGTRVYASAGLPGADWWACGPATGAEATVDVAEVEAFLVGHGLLPKRG